MGQSKGNLRLPFHVPVHPNRLMPYAQVGEHRVIFLYGILAIGYVHTVPPSSLPITSLCNAHANRNSPPSLSLELVVWLVPSLVGGGIAVSFVGVVLGPIYPIVMNHAGRILPARLLTGSIGWMAGFGQAGSAVLPFITGAIASKTGIKGLQPLCVLHSRLFACGGVCVADEQYFLDRLVSLMGFMVVLWALVPHAPRRIE